MKHTIHKWGTNILSIHEGLGAPICCPNQKNDIFHEKIICFGKNPGKIRAKIRAKLNFVILSSFYDLGHVQTGILRFGEQLHNALNVH